jgi:hypothetical protein
MAKVIEWNRAAPTCSIPLELAMYCVNCNTISNSRPHQCGVCGSEAVLRVQPILDPDPEPPAAQWRILKLARCDMPGLDLSESAIYKELCSRDEAGIIAC